MRDDGRPVELEPARKAIPEPQAVPNRRDSILRGLGNGGQTPQLAVIRHAHAVVRVPGIRSGADRGEAFVPTRNPAGAVPQSYIGVVGSSAA